MIRVHRAQRQVGEVEAVVALVQGKQTVHQQTALRVPPSSGSLGVRRNDLTLARTPKLSLEGGTRKAVCWRTICVLPDAVCGQRSAPCFSRSLLPSSNVVAVELKKCKRISRS